MTLPTSLKFRTVVRFPARVTASSGISVQKSNGIYAFSQDINSLTTKSSIATSERDNIYFAGYDTDNSTFRKIAVDTLASSLASTLDTLITTTGSGNAYLATSTVAYSSLTTGIRLVIKPNFTNTSSATLNLTPSGGGAFGAKSIRKLADGAGTDVVLASGDIQKNGVYEVVYDSTANGGLGAWIVQQGIPPALTRVGTSLVVYVSPSGADEDGRGLSSSVPFATLTYAYNYLRDRVHLGGYQGIISLAAAGTYTTGLDADGPVVGDGIDTGIQVIGSTSAPGSYIIQASSGNCLKIRNGARIYLRGVKLDGSVALTDLVYVGEGSKFSFDSVIFGDAPGGYDVQAGSGGSVSILGNYQIVKTSVTRSCGLTNTSATVTCANTSGITAGMGAYAATGNIPNGTYVVSVVANTSVTLSHAATATNTENIQYSTGGLAHLQGDPGARFFSNTSIGDGGLNQIFAEVSGRPYYSNALLFFQNSYAFLSRLAFVESGSAFAKTGTWSASSTSMTVNNNTSLVIGQRVIHPDIAWGTTISNIVGTTITLSQASVGAASSEEVVFADQAGVNGLPFAIYDKASLDARMDVVTSLPDLTVLPGWRFTVSGTYSGGTNKFTVSAGDAALISAIFARYPSFRGLMALNNDFLPGTVIPSSSSISGTTITVDRPISGTGSGATITIAGFCWGKADYLGSLNAPIPIVNIPVVPQSGGTGLATYTLGDTIYASAANTLSRLSGNTTTTRKFMRQTGDGAASAAPVWDTILAADISGAALTRVDDTNVTLTLGGSPTTALLNATSITVGWSGQLAVSRGGTGLSSGTSGGLLYFSAAGTLASSTAFNQFAVLIGGGTGAAPSGITVGTNGQLLIGQTSAAPAFTTVSGDITITSGGVTAVGSNKITDAMVRQSAGLSLIGRSANTTGNVADIQATAASGAVLRESGSTIGFGTIATAGIGANQVTNAKLATMANSTFKCRTTAGTGDPEDCTATQAAAILNTVGGVSKSKVITFTRDLSAASGSVAYTGCGFSPTSLKIMGADSSTQVQLNGVADSARGGYSLWIAGGAYVVSSTPFSVGTNGSTFQSATITSYDSDGFTLSWTKTGSPTGTVTYAVLCER